MAVPRERELYCSPKQLYIWQNSAGFWGWFGVEQYSQVVNILRALNIHLHKIPFFQIQLKSTKQFKVDIRDFLLLLIFSLNYIISLVIWNIISQTITIHYTVHCIIRTSVQSVKRQYSKTTSEKSELVTYKNPTQVARNILVSFIWNISLGRIGKVFWHD